MDGTVRVWVDGQLVGPGQPAVPALDHAVTVGHAAFETLKVVDGVPFAVTRHLRRLRGTLAGLGLGAPDEDLIAQGCAAVLGSGEPLEFGRLRYTVTGGVGPLGAARGDASMSYIVTAGPQPRPPASVAVVTVPWVRNERSATAGLKTTSYAENVVALARAASAGAAEAVFANTRDELCEAAAANIFVVRDGVVRTPPLDSGCLAGVTRGLAIEWCREVGLEVREEVVPMGSARDADEVFLTSTTKDVLAVHAWDDRTYAAPGPLTARAAAAFTRLGAERVDP